MNTLVVVSMGELYVRSTEVAVATFRKHNPTWSVARYYNKDLEAIVPDELKEWSAFSKCEIGRWCAMLKTLREGADHVLYCDGDFQWYGPHVSDTRMPLLLTPHQITVEGRWKDFNRRMGDGVVNLGLIEAYKDAADVLDAFIKLVARDASRWVRKKKLWLQFPIDAVALMGYKTALNTHPAVNVARWNVGSERVIEGTPEHPVVKFQDKYWPLSSMHFSGYKHMQGRAGGVVDALIQGYELLHR
jgi:hypothetical protein